jgi:O-antigen ligase
MLVLPAAAGLWFSYDVRYSLPRALLLFFGVAVCLATVGYSSSLRRLRMLVGGFIVLGTAVAGVSLVGTNWLYKSVLLAGLVRRLPQLVKGLPGAAQGFHPNEVAGVLVWCVPLQMALLAFALRRGRVRSVPGALLAASTVLSTCTLILTQSRSGLFGLAAGVALMGSLSDRRLAFATLSIVLLLVGVVAVKGTGWAGAILFRDEVSEVVGTLNWRFRIHVWQAALWGVRDFPFTGMGMGSFRRLAPELYLLPLPSDFDIAHAHNGFLQAGVDLGILGIVGYAGVYLAAARMVLSSLRLLALLHPKELGAEARALATGMAGCLTSSFVYSWLDAVALGAKPMPMWWMLIGLMAALHRLSASCAATEAGRLVHT